jgi:hypothetical protein
MPQTKKNLVMQSCCRIDVQPPDWILSSKVSPQLLWKRLNSKPSFSETLITHSKMFMPQTQFPCRIDGRPPDWILSTTTTSKLLWKRTNSNTSFSATPINRSKMCLLFLFTWILKNMAVQYKNLPYTRRWMSYSLFHKRYVICYPVGLTISTVY